jgi:purine-nucleoside phosphorylase
MIDRASSPSVSEAAAYIRSQTARRPEVGLILGSGLGDLAETASEAAAIETADIPGYPRSTVEGHSGRLVFGKLEGREVVFVQGRVHRYEGHDNRHVTFPVRLLHEMGVRHLVITNAAGGINPAFGPGTLMFITDHINFAFNNPLVGPNEDDGPRFPDMSAPYDLEWVDRAEAAALEARIATQRGVYVWTLGPSYETPAEVRALARMGADAVGMSTVPETIQARYHGIRVLGISTITNPAAGLSSDLLDHDDVLAVGRAVRADLERLIRLILQKTLG